MNCKTIIPPVYKDYQFTGGNFRLWHQDYWRFPMDIAGFGLGDPKNIPQGNMPERVLPKQPILNYP